MKKEPLYVTLSPEVESLLADNEIDIVTELLKRGFDVEKNYGVLKDENSNESRTKDISLIILTSATAFGAVSMGIAHVLSTINSKPVIVKNKKQSIVKDSKGNALLDDNGKPIFEDEVNEILVTPDTSNESSITAKLGNLFSFEFLTGKGK